MSWYGPVFGGTAALTGAALDYFGARQANKANIAQSRQQMDYQTASNERAMEFAGAQAANQMAFQERMSNTAWQRGVADMQSAGINPMAAFSQGGASSPSGSSASGQSSSGSRADIRNQYSRSISTALQAMTMLSQVERTNAETAAIKAELPEKEATGAIYKTPSGKVLKWLEKIMNPASKISTTFRR